MIERHGYEPPYELEVEQVVRVDVAGRVDLQAVVVLVGVFEQAVHGVQHLVRYKEEPLATHAAVIQTLFAAEYYVQSSAQLVRG